MDSNIYIHIYIYNYIQFLIKQLIEKFIEKIPQHEVVNSIFSHKRTHNLYNIVWKTLNN